jgi:hypothetical protein
MNETFLREAMLADFFNKKMNVLIQASRIIDNKINKEETLLAPQQNNTRETSSDERIFDHYGRQSLCFDRMARIPLLCHATSTFDRCRGPQIQDIPHHYFRTLFVSRPHMHTYITVWKKMRTASLATSTRKMDPTKLSHRRQGHFIASCLKTLQNENRIWTMVIIDTDEYEYIL